MRHDRQDTPKRFTGLEGPPQQGRAPVCERGRTIYSSSHLGRQPPMRPQLVLGVAGQRWCARQRSAPAGFRAEIQTRYQTTGFRRLGPAARTALLWLRQCALDAVARGRGDRTDHGNPLSSQQRLAHSPHAGMEAAHAAQAGSERHRLHPAAMGGSGEEKGQKEVMVRTENAPPPYAGSQRSLSVTWRPLTGKRDMIVPQIRAQSLRQRYELRRHHDDGRGVLFGADLRDHLHPPQFEAEGAVSDLPSRF
jgi:hypothetical protein